MRHYWIKTTAFLKKIFPNYIWSIPNSENKIYLTFDDGPTPEITEWVLDELNKHKAKATFFCIGNNIEKHTIIFEKVINNGHSVGNHTFNHWNGWKTSTEEYLENVNLCQKAWEVGSGKWEVQNLQPAPVPKLRDREFNLFRPPYGKIKASQSKKLRELGYKIIMWDVLSADFDTTITPEKCLENVLKNVCSGSIIVFHDSVKAFPNLKYTLPKALKYWTEKGFVFEKLD